MFEVRLIGTRTKFKPVKKPEGEIPSVELAAELVEVELEELRFYVMPQRLPRRRHTPSRTGT